MYLTGKQGNMSLQLEVFLCEPKLKLIRSSSKILFNSELKQNSHANITIQLVFCTEKDTLTISKKR